MNLIESLTEQTLQRFKNLEKINSMKVKNNSLKISKAIENQKQYYLQLKDKE